MSDDITTQVGIASPGQVVVVECKQMLRPVDVEGLRDQLDKAYDLTGVHFVLLDPVLRVARVEGSDGPTD
jgi:hypothetical protein